MGDNNPSKKDDYFHVVRCNDSVVEQITSVKGNKVNILTLKQHDDNWTQIIHVTYNFVKMPMEKHGMYKFPWHTDTLDKEFKKKAELCSSPWRRKGTSNFNLPWYLSDWTEHNGDHEDC